MAKRRFLHELPDFRELVELVARNKNMRAIFVEKDYWLMHSLWGLNELGFKFELKGGTSLSKGYNLIERFSEDVDIRIEPPSELKVKIGQNHDKPVHVESRRRFYEWIVSKLVIPGIVSVERDTEFDDEKLRNAGIRLNYKSLFELDPVIKTFVLLEVGFDTVTPNDAIHISSWAYDYASLSSAEIIDNRALYVKCYHPEYTLVEKLSAISSKFRQEQLEGKLPKNFMRHYFDVHCLLKSDRVVKFIGSPKYVAHKEKRFSSKDVKDLTKNEAFLLSNIETKMKYAKEYERIRDFFYGTPPSFEEIISEIQKFLPRL